MSVPKEIVSDLTLMFLLLFQNPFITSQEHTNIKKEDKKLKHKTDGQIMSIATKARHFHEGI